MKKLISLIAFSILLVSTVIAQEPDTTEEKLEPLFYEKASVKALSKLHYGGNINIGFINQFYLDLAPLVGYEITNKGTIAGVGARIITAGGTNAFGFKGFVRQPLFRNFYADLEYETMNAEKHNFYSYIDNVTTNPTAKIWEGSPLVGIGMYQNRSRAQGGSFISLMYNLGQLNNTGFRSPYGLFSTDSPISIRIGYLF